MINTDFRKLLEKEHGLLETLKEANSYETNNIDINFASISNSIMAKIRELYIYIRNDYMVEFCWWHNITEQNILFRDIITKDEEVKYEVIDKKKATYLDKLSPFWEKIEKYNYTLISKDIIKNIRKNKKITIDPNNDKVKIELNNDEHEGVELYDYTKIYAYSFGPWNTEEYFRSKDKIIVINWEPYMQSGDLLVSETEGRKLGYRDQANEYNSCSEIEASTIKENISFCSSLLNKMGYNNDEEFKKHMCILEHNLFPGLAFNSLSSDIKLIKKWAELNHDLLEMLLTFYKPTIVLGHRDLLGYACGGNDATFNQALGGTDIFLNISKGKFLGRKIIFAGKIKLLRNKFAGIVDEMGTIWIGGTHFSRNNWTKNNSVHIIIEWIIDKISLVSGKNHKVFGNIES